MEHDRPSIEAVRKRGGFDSSLDPYVLSLDREEQERLARGFRDAGRALAEQNEQAASSGEESNQATPPAKETPALGLWERIILFIMQLFTGVSKKDFIKNRELAVVATHVRTFRPALYHYGSNRLLAAFGETVSRLATAMAGLRKLCEACRFTGSEGGGKGFAEFFVRQMVPELPDIEGRYTAAYLESNRKLFEDKRIKLTVEQDVEKAMQCINYEARQEINRLYANFVAFLRLAFFNYYTLLRRFGENCLAEQFSSVEGNEALFDLTRLEELLYGVDLTVSMEPVFSALSGFARMLSSEQSSSTQETAWTEDDSQRLSMAISTLLQDERLVSIIRLITRDPRHLPAIRPIAVNPVEEMKAIVRARLVPKIRALLHQIDIEELEKHIAGLFGTLDLPEFEFYNEATNRRLQAMELPLFLHCKQMQVVKAFQTTMFEAMIHPALNPLVMEGEFIDKQMQMALGDYFYRFGECCEHILEFEAKVSLATTEGEKIQNLILRFSGDNPTRKIITDKIYYLNNLAAKALRELALIVLQAIRPLTAIVRDGTTQHKPEFVRNIRQIGGGRNKLVIKAVQRVLEVTNGLAGILEPYTKEG